MQLTRAELAGAPARKDASDVMPGTILISHGSQVYGLRSRVTFATRAQARAVIAAWIEDYNTARRGLARFPRGRADGDGISR